MRIIAYHGESTVAELVERLFRIKPSARRARRLKIEHDLLQLNPHLSDLSKVPKGTLIFVPDVPGVEPKPEPAPSVQPLDEAKEVWAKIGELLQEAASRPTIEEEQAAMLKRMGDEFAKLEPVLTGRIGGAPAICGDLLAAMFSLRPETPEATGTGTEEKAT